MTSTGSTTTNVCSVASDSLQPHRLKPTRLSSPWTFPGKNTGVDCHFLLHIESTSCFKKALGLTCVILSKYIPLFCCGHRLLKLCGGRWLLLKVLGTGILGDGGERLRGGFPHCPDSTCAYMVVSFEELLG